MAVSAAGSALTVAIWVCGAASRKPGEKTMTKLIPKVSQSITRRLAISTSTLRPSTLMVSRSPGPIPMASPTSASRETSGGPS